MTVKTRSEGSIELRSSALKQEQFNFAPWTDLRPVQTTPVRQARAPSIGVGLMERAGALIMLVIVSPLMVLIAAAIKLDSRDGPVLYRQERVGLDRRRGQTTLDRFRGDSDRRRDRQLGKPFRICKFRTMVPDAEKSTGPVWASNHDPRVTRVGQILRHTRLDELPQLFNIIAGEMRLIGPRPERPHFVSQLATEIPEYPRRQLVPPGITGLAQIEKQYDSSVDDVRTKVKYDLFYVKNKSSLLDIKILLRTIDVVIRGRGAR